MKRTLGVMVAIVLAMASSANAATATWNVDAAGDWVTAANWSPALAPVTGDNVVLGNIITASRILTLSGPFSLTSLTVNNTNVGSLYTLSATAARNLTLTGIGTQLSVGALGANLGLSASPTFITFVLPNTAGMIWDIGGPTYVGTVNGGGAAATLTKTGSGQLIWGGSGVYGGTLTVNAGNLRMTGSPTGLGNFLMTPTGVGDLTYDGTGWLGLAASKTARFLGTASGNVIVSPGTTAGGLSLLKMGSATTNTVTLDNLSRYNADVNGAVAASNDTLGVLGTLNLGAAGTTNSLYISLAAGTLQNAYVLAGASNALSGKFNQVYYNNVLVASPETAGSIGGTNQLVYGAKSVFLVNPATNRRTYWVNPDTATNAANYWDVGGNWTKGSAPTSADNVFISYGTAFLAGTGNSRTVGSFRTDGRGTISLGNNWTLTTRSDNGASGDFWWGNTTDNPGGIGHTMNIYGNLWIGTLYYQRNGAVDTINLYGTNKAVAVYAYDEWSGSQGDANVQNIYGSYWENSTVAAPDRQRYYQNRNTVTVKVGGQILTRPDAAPSQWAARRFIFEGGQANLPALKSPVDFIYQPAQTDNGPPGANRLVIAGGVTYPRDVKVGADYWNPKQLQDATYTWRIKGGDFTVGRDFLIAETGGNSPNDGMFVNFEENGTLGKVKVKVLRDMTLSSSSSGGTTGATGTRGSFVPTYAERYGMRGKNAEIRVGQNLTIGYASSAYYAWWPVSGNLVDLGNATIYVGQNLTVHRLEPAVARPFWNAGTSTIICDGNGTGKTQQIRTFSLADNIKLNNFIVRNPGGIVTLENAIAFDPAGLNPYTSYPRGNGVIKQGGDLLLSGNLSIESGTFRTGDTNEPGRQIAFNGDCHTIYVAPGAIVQGTVWSSGTSLTRTNGVFDNIILRPDAKLTLLSDITIAYNALTTNPKFQDNLVMMAGSKLYLNTFTLMAEGNTWVSAQVDSVTGVPWDQGTIYGTMAIPEPATWLLLGTGVLGVIGYARRRRMT